MNILVSTTTNWNPGDEFIRYGIEHLLNPDHNYFFYDRNPDFFTENKFEMSGRTPRSNCFTSNIPWNNIDAVILAGSPEWLHGPLKYIYEGLMNNPHIPLYCIGVGYSAPVLVYELTNAEIEVLNRDTTVIITRDTHTKNIVKPFVKKQIHTLPCPALFASMKYNIWYQDTWLFKDRSLYVLQGHSTEQGRLEVIQDKMIINNHDFLTYYKSDYLFLNVGKYLHDPVDIIKHISQYSYVTTNRVHAGIVALSQGASVFFNNSSLRVLNMLLTYEPYLEHDTPYVTLKKTAINDISEQYRELLKDLL